MMVLLLLLQPRLLANATAVEVDIVCFINILDAEVVILDVMVRSIDRSSMSWFCSYFLLLLVTWWGDFTD
jgi:hypothetical protein